MRPISNLVKPPDFKLSRQAASQGFYALFDIKGRAVSTELFYALVAGSLIPAMREYAIKADKIQPLAFAGARSNEELVPYSVHSVLRKNTLLKRFEFSAILTTMLADSIQVVVPGDMTQQARLGDKFIEENILSIRNFDQTPLARGPISGKEVAATFAIPAKLKASIEKSLVSIEGKLNGNRAEIWVNWAIGREEIEFITNTPFNEIRPSDIYPALIQWSSGVFGRYSRVPKQINKISKISLAVKTATSEKPVNPRTGLDGMVTDILGHFYVIPDVDASAEYEQLLMDYGLREDGSYTWTTRDESMGTGGTRTINVTDSGRQKKKLPINMPVFTDWLNDKFCYSNSAGNLDVYDLSETSPVKAFQIRLLLETEIGQLLYKSKGSVIDAVGRLELMLRAAEGIDPSISTIEPVRADGGADADFFEELLRARAYKGGNSIKAALEFNIHWSASNHVREGSVQTGDIKLYHFGINTQVPILKYLARRIEKASKVLADNLEVCYTRYSVMTSLQFVALSKIITKYADRYDNVVAEDTSGRDVYLNQEPDPEWKNDGIPYMAEGKFFQPHQAKIDNVMRRSPDFAAYDVDAGGGKSLLVITNLLNEMKKGVSKRPIILCPPTLTAQYVEEFVFFTHGRVNCIPITNTSLRMHGYDRLKMMIEKAPVNTVIVSDWLFVSGKARKSGYGNKSLLVFTNAEWLRQFEFDLVAVDESHQLSNLNSARRAAVARLIQDIPKKRIASGTLVNNTTNDLVSQIALFDPTIFGSKKKFVEEFAENPDSERVVQWKPGAERAIRRKIQEHVVFATARRKEWAALLPEKVEQFHAEELTDNQRLLYESILKETTDLIEEAMATDPDLAEAMEESSDDLEAKLRPYLARLEKFLSAPEYDELADTFLTQPKDRVSPKISLAYEICRDHIRQELPGKILIFTNFRDSAESFIKNAPSDLKDMILHYKAETKVEDRAKIAQSQKLKIMVGASASMNTGLNLQMFSRLIRMETVWTPGLVEQGNARINRPEMKKAENRNRIYFDWIAVNRTIDITKISRLIAKIVSKAKFDEAENEAYQQIPDMPVLPMKLENIRELNDFENELGDYLQTYQTYQQVEHNEFRRYAEEVGDKAERVPIKPAPMLKDSKLMSRIPYIPGMTLYGSEDLGLVRFDEFVHEDLEEVEQEGESEDSALPDADEDTTDPRLLRLRAKWEREEALAKGMPVHTEFGDGTIYKVKRKVWVHLNDGSRMRMPKFQVFVITRSTTNNKDIRTLLLKQNGDIPFDVKPTVPVETGTQTIKKIKKIKEQEEEEAKTQVELRFSVINDMLAIVMDGQENADGAVVLQNFGFRRSPEYYFTKIIGPRVLFWLIEALHKKGFTLDKKMSLGLKTIWQELLHNKKAMQNPSFATSMGIRDFTRELIKPSSDAKELKIYPRVEDGVLYLMMPKKGQPSTAKAIRVPSKMIKWIEGGGDAEYLRFCKNITEAKSVIKEITDSGIVITNAKQLEVQYKRLRMQAPAKAKG